MDIVITYVDGLDPLWRKDYADFVGQSILTKRFRDWDTLKYLLRGIEAYMPFVDNVFLVVARDSQVPEWVDRSVLKVVLHEDFIPRQYLPVFNCNPIEMCLHRIPGLSEQYIYFNDDMFPLNPVNEEDFFQDGRPVMGYATQFFKFGMYRKICVNSYKAALRAAGKASTLTYLRPQHTPAPMLRSACEKVSQALKDEIALTMANRVRGEFDLNQYVFTDFQAVTGIAIRKRLSNKHFSLAASSIEKVCRFVENPDMKMACINDVTIPDEQFVKMKAQLLASFEKRLPVKSRFELKG